MQSTESCLIGSSVSLVDRTSFALKYREGFRRETALDVDFRTAAFETLPWALRTSSRFAADRSSIEDPSVAPTPLA
jgi:hypothetical protein